jgi:diphthine methyl ester synthase
VHACLSPSVNQLLTAWIRGRKIYEPPRYMSIPIAVAQMLEVEARRQTGTLSPADTLAIALSRVGAGSEQKIVCGTLSELAAMPEERFGKPLHSLIIVGRRLHHLEVLFAEEWAPEGSRWREVARSVYGCLMDDA